MIEIIQDENIANPRDKQVIAILRSAPEPLGPTEIARRIGEPWCLYDGGYPQSSAINPILKRIGAIRVGSGQYKLKDGEEQIRTKTNRKPPVTIAGKGKTLGNIVDPMVDQEDWKYLD